MVQIFPPTINKDAVYSERSVFNAIEAITDKPDWICLHSLHQRKVVDGFEAEGDFIILIPNLGILVIESKGATEVTLDGETWTLEGVPEAAKHKSPLEQADKTKNNLRAQLKANDFDVDHLPIARLVWFPKIEQHMFTEVGKKGMLFSIWELAFKPELKNPAKTIENTLTNFIASYKDNKTIKFTPQVFDKDLMSNIKDAILTKATGHTTIDTLAEIRHKEVAKASEDLDMIFDAVSENANLFLNGLAGTGKSKILGMAAANLASSGHKVLITCYSLMLANHYELNYGKHPNIEVYNINDLFLLVSQQREHKSGDDWYDRELPIKAKNAVSLNPQLAEYDAICIDEYQDISTKPEVVDAIFRFFNPETQDQRIVVAADDWQQIFKGEDDTDSFSTVKEMFPDLVKVNLVNNFRQSPGLSKQVYQFLNGIAPKSRVPKDTEWSFTIIRTSKETETKDLTEVLKKLSKKFRPEDIRILSPHGPNKSLAARSIQNQQERYLTDTLKDGKGNGNISWRSIGKYKGLEDDVVIITDISQASVDFCLNNRNTIEEMLYVGMTRARFHLVLMISDNLFPEAKSANPLF